MGANEKLEATGFVYAEKNGYVPGDMIASKDMLLSRESISMFQYRDALDYLDDILEDSPHYANQVLDEVLKRLGDIIVDKYKPQVTMHIANAGSYITSCCGILTYPMKPGNAMTYNRESVTCRKPPRV